MNWLDIFFVPFSLDLFEPEIGMTEERVISFSLNNVIALITRVFLSATLSIPIFVIRGRWWTRQWKRISIGRKWSSRPGATHVADCLRSRRRCHGSGSSSSSSSSSRRVTAVSLSVLTETRRIHASTAAPRLCWRSLLRQLIGSLLIDDQLSPDVRPNSWFVSLLFGNTL